MRMQMHMVPQMLLLELLVAMVLINLDIQEKD
jgi:hypothetical protein